MYLWNARPREKLVHSNEKTPGASVKTSLKISVSVLFQAGVNDGCIRIVDG